METIYTNTINTEKKSIQFAPFFNMNLVRPTPIPPEISFSHNRMETVTEKVEKQSPAQRMDCTSVDSKSFETAAIRHLLRGPTEKYTIPVKTSHDIGWLIDKPQHAKRIQEKKPKPNTTTPMLSRNKYTPMRRTLSDPLIMSPMLMALNTKKWHKYGNQKSDVHAYAENYYNCMHANPYQKTQPLARGG
jgi:hypothetical protein